MAMKNLKLFLLVLTIMVVETTYSQPQPLARSIADSLREEGDIKGAIDEYNKAYLKNPGNKVILYNYACALSIGMQIDSCLKYLNKVIEKNASIAPLVDPDFLNAREDKRWIDFENKLVSLLNGKANVPIVDVEYAKKLWCLMALDQAYMYEIGIAVRKLGFTSPVVIALQKLKDVTNQRNQQYLEELIAKKGWPKISEVGQEAAGTAFYIVQHSNADLQQKYIPILKKLCEEKEASCIHFAMLYDRMKMNQNLPQRYGTQMNLDNRITGAVELYPLEDAAKVDEWRKELGLEPLKEFLAKMNINYDAKK